MVGLLPLEQCSLVRTKSRSNEEEFLRAQDRTRKVGNCSFPVEKNENRGFPVVRSQVTSNAHKQGIRASGAVYLGSNQVPTK